ncbi:nickel/cobalt transporter [Fulvimarina sp. MAC3]|uniref:nickel/cobalt transporter n=1 Tax=Fulvimarina sp. MAC3 TaxID=3148887 RepID=UPI0031FD7315
MRPNPFLRVLGGGCLAALVIVADASARSSLGIGTADTTAPVGDGLFSGVFTQIAIWQRDFFSALRHALVGLKSEDGALVYLVGLSLAYGVFHAAGPGHGKAVISAYMLASRAQLKRGILLSFVSSTVQGLTAVIVVGIGWYLLRGTDVSMTDATNSAEIASYVLVLLVGLYLLLKAVRKLARDPFAASLARRGFAPIQRLVKREPAPGLSLAFSNAGTADWREPDRPASSGSSSFAAAEGFDSGTVCVESPGDCDCGRAHMPAPDTVSQPLTLRSGLAAVFAVGLRPCTGAIVVLTFALLNELYAGGVLSVFAMSIGTATTVSVIATVTVLGRGGLERIGRKTRFAAIVGRSLEIAGALALTLVGIGLLGGALAG